MTLRRAETTLAVGRVPLVDEVAALMRERIYSGTYPGGTRLLQEQLSVELQVSRTPLREALRSLEQEGLIEVDARQAVRVVTGDLSALLQAYALRSVVDGLAARLAAEGAGRSRTHHLDRVLDRQRAAVDPWEPQRYTEANFGFHEQIVHMANNEFVTAQTPLLRMTAQVFSPVALLSADNAQRAIREHVAICAAIAAGDGPAAELLARAHIEETIRQLHLQSSADPPVGPATSGRTKSTKSTEPTGRGRQTLTSITKE